MCKDFRYVERIIVVTNFLTSSIVICLNGINLIISSGASKLIYVNYIMTMLIQAFVYCFGGQVLIDSVSNDGQIWCKWDWVLAKMSAFRIH